MVRRPISLGCAMSLMSRLIDVGCEAGRDHLAVGADIRRPVESRRERRLGLAFLLARLRPHRDLLRMDRVAHVENDQDVGVVARHRGREIGIFAAGIGIAMRAVGAAHPFRQFPGILRIADVPEPDGGGAFLRMLIAVGGGDHQIVVDGHLRGDRVLGPRNEADIFRIGRIGDVDDAPAVIEGMAGIEIPAPVRRMLQGELERAELALQPGEADRLDLVRRPARRNRIRQRRPRGDERRRRGGKPENFFHRVSSIRPRIISAHRLRQVNRAAIAGRRAVDATLAARTKGT